jgi:hypothetical protein
VQNNTVQCNTTHYNTSQHSIERKEKTEKEKKGDFFKENEAPRVGVFSSFLSFVLLTMIHTPSSVVDFSVLEEQARKKGREKFQHNFISISFVSFYLHLVCREE